MNTIEVKEESGIIRWKNLQVYHGDCHHGKIVISEVEAIINKGTRRTGKDETDLARLICKGCGRKFWVPLQSEAMASVVNTAADGKERIIEIYSGKLIDQEYHPSKRLLNAEKIDLKVQQIKTKDIPGGSKNVTTNTPN